MLSPYLSKLFWHHRDYPFKVAQMIKEEENFQLLDVREDWERAQVKLLHLSTNPSENLSTLLRHFQTNT